MTWRARGVFDASSPMKTSISAALLFLAAVCSTAPAQIGEPTALTVDSNGLRGVPVTLTAPDRAGRTGGDTRFFGVYLPGDPYQVNAPFVHDTSTRAWIFQRWDHQVGAGAISAQPAGRTSFSRSSIDRGGETVTAEYAPGCRIRLRNGGEPGGWVVPMADRDDVFGRDRGQTPFDLVYPADAGVIRFEILNLNGGFMRWSVNGVLQPIRQREIEIDTRTATGFTLTAIRGDVVPGSAERFGSGCTDGAGGNFLSARPSDETPFIGDDDFKISLRNAPPNTPATAMIGFDDSAWAGGPLPMLLPGTRFCRLYIDPAITLPVVTSGVGTHHLPLPIPGRLDLSGTGYFLQYLVFASPANQTGWRTSNAVEVVIGGFR